MKNASSAAYTHLVHNPEDNISVQNVKWYKSNMSEDVELVDREAYVRIL